MECVIFHRFVLRDFESWRWCGSASFLADRDQDEKMSARLAVSERNAGWQPVARNLATITDVVRVNQLQSRVGRNQIVQIDHRAAVLPQESANFAGFKTHLRCAHDLAPGID